MEEKRHVFSRRGFLAGAGGLGGVVFLAACGAVPVAQTGEMAEEEAPAKEAEEAPAMEEKIMRIDETFVESDGRYQAFRNTLAQAEEALGITTEIVPGEYSTIWERRQTNHAAGQADVDLSINQINWYGYGGLRGIFPDHIPYFQRDKISLEDYFQADLRSWTWQNKLYAVPMQSGGEVVLFNKEYFDEAGLNYPGGDWTYDDLLSMAERLHKPDDGRWALQVGQNSLWYMGGTFLLNFGGSIMNENDTKALYGEDPLSLRGAQFNVDLHLKHQYTPSGEDIQKVTGGRSGIGILEVRALAMEFNGMFRYNAAKTHLEDALDIAMPPRDQRSTATLVGNGYSLMTLSPNQETAWSFLKYIHSDEGAEETDYFGFIAWPPIIRHGLFPKWAARYEGTQVEQVVNGWAAGGRPFPRVLEFSEAFGPSNAPWYQALRGEITVAEGLRQSADILNEVLDRRPEEYREA